MKNIRLTKLIIKKFGTQKKFAESIGISESELSRCLYNGNEWSANAIAKSVELLGIPEDIIECYFSADNNKNLLSSVIVSRYGSLENFCKVADIDCEVLQKELNTGDIRADRVVKIAEILDVNHSYIDAFFFASAS